MTRSLQEHWPRPAYLDLKCTVLEPSHDQQNAPNKGTNKDLPRSKMPVPEQGGNCEKEKVVGPWWNDNREYLWKWRRFWQFLYQEIVEMQGKEANFGSICKSFNLKEEGKKVNEWVSGLGGRHGRKRWQKGGEEVIKKIDTSPHLWHLFLPFSPFFNVWHEQTINLFKLKII